MIQGSLSMILFMWICLLRESLAICPPGFQIQSGGTVCTEIICPDGQYYDATSSQCLTCNSTCSLCKFFSNYCSQCKTGFYLYNQSCVTQCPQTQTYVSCTNGVCECQACNSSCFECYGNKNTQCLSCNSSYYFNQVNTSCMQDCEDGYTKLQTKVGDNTLLTCTPCDNNCYTCDQNNSKLCLTCKSNMYLYNNQCVNTCPSSYYKHVNYCKACPIGCQDCYLNDNQSNPSGIAESCQSCTQNYALDVENQACLLSCNAGYVLDQTTQKCIPCHPSCKNCTDSSNESCTQCQNGFSLLSASPSSCQNICAAGNYSNNSLCLSCNTSCSECFGSDSKQCTKCKQDYFLYKTECVVICPITLFTYAKKFKDPTIQPICDYCPFEMEQCEQDSVDLTLINPILCKKGYYLEDGKCVKTCKDQTFYPYDPTDQVIRVCKACQFPCLQCLTDSICLSCASYTLNGNNEQYVFTQITMNGLNGVIFQQNCLPSCPDGFYADPTTKKCLQCQLNCMTCSGPAETDCITCQQYDENNQLYQNNKQCFYTCPQSQTNPMYGDNQTQQCTSCSIECSSCFQSDNQSCYSCVSGYFLEYLKPECKSFCGVEGTFMNTLTNTCDLCGFGCLTCTDRTFNSCISCQEGYYLQTEYNVCNPCPKECKSCTSNDACQSCNSGYFFLAQNSSCVSTCPLDDYFTNSSTGTCDMCDSSCLECYGSSNNQCITCPIGFYLDKTGKCSICNSCAECTGPNTNDCLNSTTCPPNQQSFDGKCITCFDNCLTCSGTTYDSCITCKSGYTLLFDICMKKIDVNHTQCDIGFYFDSDDKQCYSCHMNCIECTGKSSSQCTRCADGFLLHRDITTCNHNCFDGYIQNNLAIPECQACLFNCNTGCSKGYSFLLGLCFTECPFGTSSVSLKCTFNNQPSIKFSNKLGNNVNNNSEAIQIQLIVYSVNSYSIVWNLYEGTTLIPTTSPLMRFIQNRQNYVVFPQKSLKSSTKYTIKASIFDTSTQCQNEDDCAISQVFTTMGDITKGTFNIQIDQPNQTLTLIVNGWIFSSSTDPLLLDVYVKLAGNDYFFFEKGKQYQDGQFSYLLPYLGFELIENKAQFFLVVYNSEDIQISQIQVVLNMQRMLAPLLSINISEFLDSLYNQISTLQQIQRASYQFYTQMLNLISSQASSQTNFNRHLFYQAYYAIKGVQLQCDSLINCSGNGQCSWSHQNYNEVICNCTTNYSGRYCEFESFQLDVAKQHLIMLVEKLSNISIRSQNDIFLAIESLISLTSFFSIFDEFTLNTVVNIYFSVFDQLKIIQTYISDEKILFKISKLTSQLIHLVNEIETLSYDDQQVLLMNTMNAFDAQINLFLLNFADSYDDLSSQEKLQTSYQTDISYISINLLYENDLLDAYLENDDINPLDSDQEQIKIAFYGDKISFTFDLNQFSPKTSLSTAVIKWNSNPFLSQSQYQAPFISCITRLIIFSESNQIEISTVDSLVEIAIPKILPTPILRTTRPYFQPYLCVYFDEVSQVYKEDGVSYLRENSTHVICTSEQISGNYGVIVNNQNIDAKLSLGEIWNATSSLYANDKLFNEFMQKQINKDAAVDNGQLEVSQEEFNPNLQLLYAILMYGLIILIFILISIVKDRRDKEHYIKESDSYWLIHPIYSLMCGPYSTFFPRLSRSLNFAQGFINYFLYNAIFVRVYTIPSQTELANDAARRQITSVLIGITSVACSILTYYCTICVINFFKIRWFLNQKWLDSKEDKITNDIVESIIKSLKVYHLMNYGLIFLLQIGMGVPIIILILTANKEQNQFFFSSLFISWVVDNVLDTVILIGFCFIRIFSKSDKSNLILFFTLRGFYFPSSEFYNIETKIKQYQENGEIQVEEQGNGSDDDIFELEDHQSPQRIFKKDDNKNNAKLEEIQLTEFAIQLETKM